MANVDSNIGSLPLAPQVDDESLLVMEQQGQAMKLTGKQIKDYAKQGLELNFKEDVDAANDAADRAVSAVKAVTEMTVDAHSSDAPTVEKSMRSGKVHLEFGLPKGDVGPVGPEGPEGPRGKQGIPGTGKAILGHYDTLEELRSAVTSPEVGDPYSVGTETPFDIWIFDGPTQDWINYGPLSLGGGGVTPEDAVTTDGGAEMFFWNGPGPHTIEVTDEELPPLTASDVIYGGETVDDAINQLFKSGSEGKALIASAVTSKGVETPADASFQEMADNIGKIETGGGDYGDATATPGDILSGKTAYVATGKVEGIIPTLGPMVYTPSVQAQQIANGQYLSGTQIIQGDTNLTSANIRKGVSIFGVDGEMTSTFQAILTVTVDIGAVATATHTNGTKVEGLSTTGKVTLELPIEGQWTVTAQRGVAQYNSVVINVSSQYTATLTAELHIIYYGNLTPLTESIKDFPGTSIGDYAVFFNGDKYYSTSVPSYASNYATAYDKFLTKQDLNTSDAYGSAGTSIGDYALFAGGARYGYSDTYRKYYKESVPFAIGISSSLTISEQENLIVQRDSFAAATIGNYALFGGGSSTIFSNGNQSTTIVSTVDSYNESMTRATQTALSISCYDLAAASNSEYAIFGGGINSTKNDIANVTSYRASLERSTSQLSVARSGLAAATAGNYVLFAGGKGGNQVVDAFDLFMTRSSAEVLSEGKDSVAGTSLKGYAIFAGSTKTVEIYDAYLVRTTAQQGLSQDIIELSAASVGDYALFAGGSYPTSATSRINTVTAYQYV